MSGDKDAYQEGRLADALVQEEQALMEAGVELADAQLNFDIASYRFAALRDMAVARMGWPFGGHPRLSGVFRFIHMGVGEAIVAALRETTETLDLEALVAVLDSGGLGAEEGGVSPRAVNAALMKTSGVMKTADGTYVYTPDSLPF